MLNTHHGVRLGLLAEALLGVGDVEAAGGRLGGGRGRGVLPLVLAPELGGCTGHLLAVLVQALQGADSCEGNKAFK